MSILASELVWRQSAVMVSGASNGGRMTATAIPSGVKNNVWPDVPQSERTSGSTKYRKVFIHVANDDDLALIAPRVFVETATPGDDSIMFFPGTFTDTESAISGSERLYGSGALNSNVSGGATSLSVLTEDSSFNYLRNGDMIRVSNKTSVDDTGGTEEFVTISSVPSYAGNVATFNITPALANAYATSSTRVGSCYQPGTVDGAVASWLETTTLGTYNEATYPVLVDSIGGIEQNWTLTFTSPSTFDVVGDTVGPVGSGNITTNFMPSNTAFSKPYFNLRSAG